MTVSIQQKKILELRDISGDLQDRVRALEEVIEKEQADFVRRQEEAAAEHRKKMDTLKRAVSNYRNMLELESLLLNRNPEPDQDKVGPTNELKIQMPGAPMPLADFFCERLRQFGELSKEHLRALAQQAGYFPEDEGRRQTHATLINITRSGRITANSDGLYQIAEGEPDLLK